MGVLDKFLDAIKLNDDYDDDGFLDDDLLEGEDDEDFLDDDFEDKPKVSAQQNLQTNSLINSPKRRIPLRTKTLMISMRSH